MDKPVTVLIAEDERDQREILTEVFECEGYRVISAASAAQTVVKLSERPDVVLLDAHGASNFEVEQTLFELGAARPPIIVISGDTRASKLAEKISAYTFLEKPYDLGDLLRIVDELTHSRARHPAMPGAVVASS